MASLLKPALAAACLAALAACSSTSPLVANHPNPPPPPGYKILCSTWRVPIEANASFCKGVIAPVEERVVVRARG